MLYQIVALGFLALSAALLFGPQLVVYGPRALSDLKQRSDARFAGGALVTAVAAIAILPYSIEAVSVGSETFVDIAYQTITMNFGLV